MPSIQPEISDDYFRQESARLVTMLTRRFGLHRLQFAEDVAQETLVRSLQTWPYQGLPDNPSAWLSQTAKNLAIDQIRRESRWSEKEGSVALEHERWRAGGVDREDDFSFSDDALRMLFVCFHPQLSVEAQTALALRILGGLSPAEIAAAFLTTEAAISKRLVRARQRIKELVLPFRVPDTNELPERLDGVLGALHLLFNEGYKTSSGAQLVRTDLCQEAIRLNQLLTRHDSSCQPKSFALLALMLLSAARFNSRTGEGGQLLRLREQDRSSWNAEMIQEGLFYLAQSGRGEELSEFHLMAGIAACHCTAASDAETNWPRILGLYEQLVLLTHSPVVKLNRAVAVAQVYGAEAGLNAISELPLESYYLFHAVRGTLMAELGRKSEAKRLLIQAKELAPSPSEREFLQTRIEECD
ncbi:sigma-70 family RNA polymerase sigma factor [Roseibacillus persicicus]|uniref:RNA polymerase sigma factor n=1 Tax=Roseibacillus persicicus TaxID=454148 RepID=UPI00398AC367